jgi:hypothetical protein
MALLPFLRGLCHPPGSAFVRWASSAWWSLPQSMDSLGRQNGSPLILPFLPHLQARVLIWNSASLHFCCILEDRKIVFKILSSIFGFLAGYHEAMGLKMFHVGWTQWLISVIPATPEAEWSIPGQKKKKLLQPHLNVKPGMVVVHTLDLSYQQTEVGGLVQGCPSQKRDSIQKITQAKQGRECASGGTEPLPGKCEALTC